MKIAIYASETRYGKTLEKVRKVDINFDDFPCADDLEEYIKKRYIDTMLYELASSFDDFEEDCGDTNRKNYFYWEPIVEDSSLTL